MSKNAFAEKIAEHNEAYEAPQENAPGNERSPTLALTGQEMFEAQFDHVAAIVSDEEQIGGLLQSISDNRSDRMSAIELKLADTNLAILADNTARVPNKELAARNLKKRAALIAQKPAIEAEAERQRSITPGSMFKTLMDFFNSAARWDAFEPANTPTDIREGESVFEANKRLADEMAGLRAEKKGVVKAQLPADDREAMARQAVHLAGGRAKLDQFVGALRNVSFDERSGFKRRSPASPEGNAFDIMCALMPDLMVASLTARAMEGYDARTTLDDVTRMERLNAIEDRMTAIEYTAESNHRYARARGENPGPRLSANPLAVLGLKRVEKK